jgi:hypothetical protein
VRERGDIPRFKTENIKDNERRYRGYTYNNKNSERERGVVS